MEAFQRYRNLYIFSFNMKSFIKYSCLLLLCSFLVLVVLDVIYSYVYYHPNYARSKVSWLKSLDSNIVFDYAVFGSSRSHYNLDPILIKKETGMNGVNMAYPNSKNFEINLMMKCFLEKYHVNTIFVQVDDMYNEEDFDSTAIVPFMPFIRDSIIYTNINQVHSNADMLKYIPFYRYMKYDAKLGFREFIMTLYKPNKFEEQLGYEIPSDKTNKHKASIFKFHLKPKPNKWLEDIISICDAKDIKVYFYTAPIYRASGNFDILQEFLPNYKDFSDVFSNPNQFENFYHLNRIGTEAFTQVFVDYYYKNKQVLP